MASPPGIVEVKRQLDGREQRFECEPVLLSATQVIVLYRVQRPGRQPSALYSYGVFWSDRPYSCYYMVRPDDDIEHVTRFDVVRDVQLSEAEVSYTDLLLDLWVEGGLPRWEDEGEVDAAVASGLLSTADREYIETARRELERGQARIREDIRAQLRSLGRLDGGE